MLRSTVWRFLVVALVAAVTQADWAQAAEPIMTLKGHARHVSSVAFSPDGKLIASASYDNTIKLWDAATGRELRTIKGPGGGVAFSPDGKWLANAGMKVITLSDVATGKLIAAWKARMPSVPCPRLLKIGKISFGLVANSPTILDMTLSPDGKRMATGSSDNRVRVWDPWTGRELLAFKGHVQGTLLGVVTSVVFSPNGKWIASASSDKTIKVWDASNGHERFTLKGGDEFSSVAFSPDGRHIVSGGCDNTVRLWDASSGCELRTLSGHTKPVGSVAFGPDGKQIASGGDKTVRLWDASTGRQLLILKGHTDQVLSVAFSPDGKWLASGGADGTIRVWSVK